MILQDGVSEVLQDIQEPPQHSGAIQKPEEDKHNSRNRLMIHILYRIRSGWCVRGCCTTPDSNHIRKHNRITSRDRNRGQACLPILTRDNNYRISEQHYHSIEVRKDEQQ
jgi:hypothetical protein